MARFVVRFRDGVMKGVTHELIDADAVDLDTSRALRFFGPDGPVGEFSWDVVAFWRRLDDPMSK